MKLALVMMLFSFSIFAQTSIESFLRDKENFCTDRSQATSVRNLTYEIDNRLSFDNNGGLFNGGVCWWHNRFTRNATYIAMFRPEMPRPKTTKEVQNIISRIRLGKNIVTIPGFKNLKEFSMKYENLIQKELNKWQIIDGFIQQQWIRGLYGRTSTTPARMEKRMDDLYTDVVVRDQIVFQHLQLSGIEAHAWLVVDMEKLENGYRLHYLDSNFNRIKTYDYNYGDSYLKIGWYGEFVAYSGKKREVRRLKKILKDFCR